MEVRFRSSHFHGCPTNRSINTRWNDNNTYWWWRWLAAIWRPEEGCSTVSSYNFLQFPISSQARSTSVPWNINRSLELRHQRETRSIPTFESTYHSKFQYPHGPLSPAGTRHIQAINASTDRGQLIRVEGWTREKVQHLLQHPAWLGIAVLRLESGFIFDNYINDKFAWNAKQQHPASWKSRCHLKFSVRQRTKTWSLHNKKPDGRERSIQQASACFRGWMRAKLRAFETNSQLAWPCRLPTSQVGRPFGTLPKTLQPLLSSAQILQLSGNHTTLSKERGHFSLWHTQALQISVSIQPSHQIAQQCLSKEQYCRGLHWNHQPSLVFFT